jgi:hypothetical protein
MRSPLLLLLSVLAVGCGPTRTAGTKGIPASQLAILHVTQSYDIPVVQVAAIAFDGGEKFKIDGERDFYLTPGVHQVSLDLTTKLDGPMKWLSSAMADTKLEGPKGLTTGDLQPGKTYEIRGLAGTMQGMMQGVVDGGGGELAITREMATK